jgi:hypothetical protein
LGSVKRILRGQNMELTENRMSLFEIGLNDEQIKYFERNLVYDIDYYVKNDTLPTYLIHIAESILKGYSLATRDWAIEIFYLVKDKARDSSDLMKIDESVPKKYYFYDVEMLADKLYREIIYQAEKSSNLMRIAETILKKKYFLSDAFLKEILKRH